MLLTVIIIIFFTFHTFLKKRSMGLWVKPSKVQNLENKVKHFCLQAIEIGFVLMCFQ